MKAYEDRLYKRMTVLQFAYISLTKISFNLMYTNF